METPPPINNLAKDLPSGEELIPLAQQLLPPTLASAFGVSPMHVQSDFKVHVAAVQTVDSLRDDRLRVERKRLVWTPQLHKRFIDVVNYLGIDSKSAVPSKIVDLMNVEGLTRDHVASHLQKYQISLKRLQGDLNGN